MVAGIGLISLKLKGVRKREGAGNSTIETEVMVIAFISHCFFTLFRMTFYNAHENIGINCSEHYL